MSKTFFYFVFIFLINLNVFSQETIDFEKLQINQICLKKKKIKLQVRIDDTTNKIQLPSSPLNNKPYLAYKLENFQNSYQLTITTLGDQTSSDVYHYFPFQILLLGDKFNLIKSSDENALFFNTKGPDRWNYQISQMLNNNKGITYLVILPDLNCDGKSSYHNCQHKTSIAPVMGGGLLSTLIIPESISGTWIGNTDKGRLKLEFNIIKEHKTTPDLQQLFSDDNPEYVELLIKKKMSLKDIDSNGMTLLHQAVSNNKCRISEALLKKRCGGINRLDNKGYSPLHYAAQSGFADICELLLQHKAKVNILGVTVGVDVKLSFKQTPLHLAARNGRVDSVRILLKYKANPNLADSRWYTPLHFGINSGNVDVVSLLLEAGAKINSIERNMGNTPLHEAVKGNFKSIVQLLVSKGADTKFKNNKKMTPCEYGRSFPGERKEIEAILS
ncbi:MAG: ankyrin repeat domain-containing protein [Candidatus Aureabacteria bacterium]|nr:ankyrin repeat domain-containing protein [Candidatus Auribacterota bacterium]